MPRVSPSKSGVVSPSLSLSRSALFPDVVNCMQTDNLELKKLVYLYLMNYAKSQPDMAIMAVNTFVKVSTLLPPSTVPRRQLRSVRVCSVPFRPCVERDTGGPTKAGVSCRRTS